MKTSASLLVMISTFVVGCASTPKMPREFDPVYATIVTGVEETKVVIGGPSGKGSGAAKGAAVGGGSCLGLGVLLCLPAGPFIPFCLAVVMPASAVSAAGGAVVGAVTSESADKVEVKRNMLTDSLNALGASQRLASLLKQQLPEAMSGSPSSEEKLPTSQDAEWIMQILLTQVATVGSGPKVPYLLQVSARLEVKRASDTELVFVKDYQALSSLKMSTPEWRANDDEPIRTALDDLMARLATDMLSDVLSLKQNEHSETAL